MARRKSGAVVGAIGLAISAACLILFWAFTPIIFLSLLLGLPAAGYALLTGWRRIGQVGFVMAIAPAGLIAIQAQSWGLGFIALLLAIATAATVWFIDRHAQEVVQANISLQRDRGR
jgi:hypothetical protein